jgi:hypothetical protein
MKQHWAEGIVDDAIWTANVGSFEVSHQRESVADNPQVLVIASAKRCQAIRCVAVELVVGGTSGRTRGFLTRQALLRRSEHHGEQDFKSKIADWQQPSLCSRARKQTATGEKKKRQSDKAKELKLVAAVGLEPTT